MQYNFDEIIDREGTSTVKYDLRQLFFGTDDVIPMWVADMDFRTPDFITDAIKKRLEHPILGYTLRPKTLNKSIINWIEKRHDWQIQEDWLTFSPGVVPAFSMAIMALTQPGDKIIVQSPVYFPFFSSVKDAGRQLLNNPLKLENGKYTIDFDDLESKIDNRTSMILLCSPHNPVGRVWTKEELQRLAEICLKNNIIILSDEIHADIIMPDYKHIPTASLSEEIAEITVSCFAPSKTFNLAGLSSSYLIIPNEKLRNRYKNFSDTMHVSNGNMFGGIAMESAYNEGENWLYEMIQYVKCNIDFLRNFLETNLPQIKLIEPESTYLLWLDFSELNLSDEDLKNFVIKKAGLGFNDGPTFGVGGKGFQRINVACPLTVVKTAMEKLKTAVEQL